jgi:hypothetical protein
MPSTLTSGYYRDERRDLLDNVEGLEVGPVYYGNRRRRFGFAGPTGAAVPLTISGARLSDRWWTLKA